MNGGIKTLDMAARHLTPGIDKYGSYEGLLTTSVDTAATQTVEEWKDLPAVEEVRQAMRMVASRPHEGRVGARQHPALL